ADRAELVALGRASTSPLVRVEALRGLMAYGPGKPDELLGRALRDPDAAVRTVAIRAIAIRNTSAGATLLGQLATRDDVLNRDPAELRSILVAWASLVGSPAIPTLDRHLARVSALTGGHRASTIEAVAFALSVIDTAAARELLSRGARSLNPRLRAACKAALEQGGRSELARLGSSPLESQPHGEGGARRTWPGGQYRPEHLAEWPVIAASRAELIPAVQSSPLLTIPSRTPTQEGAPVTPTPRLGPSPLLASPRMPELLASPRAPEALAPVELTPDALVPVELTPEALVPVELTPDALVPVELTPDALALDALVPDAHAPDALVPDADALDAHARWSIAADDDAPRLHADDARGAAQACDAVPSDFALAAGEDGVAELPAEVVALERLPSDAIVALPLDPEPVVVATPAFEDDPSDERFPELSPPPPPSAASLAALDWGALTGDLAPARDPAATGDLSPGTGADRIERDVTSEVPRPRALRAWSGITPLPEGLAGPGEGRS
ncbi:hypothetical protein L6R52_23100, partial [Myxococcota bacterium]|nr:hypothetical protein [Myxococcota bacterium]